MSPCPLCWLRTHGFPQISEMHGARTAGNGKTWWEWLAEHGEDKDVKAAFDLMPSGLVDD